MQSKNPQNAALSATHKERSFMIRALTAGVVSYLAHKIWTKRKMFTARWYTGGQTENEQVLITAFEYLSIMGLIFALSTLTSVTFGKLEVWIKGALR
ncbi:hypothetical protein Plhal703r1_c58g0163381 [Plasmopara halstedii]